MKITAAVTEESSGPFVIQELELGALAPDEVLVEVAAAGICHTDLIVRDQWLPTPLPAVLGHEGAGVVSAVGSAVTNVAPGDRVGMSFNSCGHCVTCLAGQSTYCHDFFGRNFAAARPDGTSALSRDAGPVHGHFFGQSSFATHAVATARNVVKLPDWVPLRRRRTLWVRHPDRSGRRLQHPAAAGRAAPSRSSERARSDSRRSSRARSPVARPSSGSTCGRRGSSSPASSAPRTRSTLRPPTSSRRSRVSRGQVPTSRSRRAGSRPSCAPRSTASLRSASAG